LSEREIPDIKVGKSRKKMRNNRRRMLKLRKSVKQLMPIRNTSRNIERKCVKNMRNKKSN
jgi:hypothetical protein